MSPNTGTQNRFPSYNQPCCPAAYLNAVPGGKFLVCFQDACPRAQSLRRALQQGLQQDKSFSGPRHLCFSRETSSVHRGKDATGATRAEAPKPQAKRTRQENPWMFRATCRELLGLIPPLPFCDPRI